MAEAAAMAAATAILVIMVIGLSPGKYAFGRNPRWPTAPSRVSRRVGSVIPEHVVHIHVRWCIPCVAVRCLLSRFGSRCSRLLQVPDRPDHSHGRVAAPARIAVTAPSKARCSCNHGPSRRRHQPLP